MFKFVWFLLLIIIWWFGFVCVFACFACCLGCLLAGFFAFDLLGYWWFLIEVTGLMFALVVCCCLVFVCFDVWWILVLCWNTVYWFMLFDCLLGWWWVLCVDFRLVVDFWFNLFNVLRELLFYYLFWLVDLLLTWQFTLFELCWFCVISDCICVFMFECIDFVV